MESETGYTRVLADARREATTALERIAGREEALAGRAPQAANTDEHELGLREDQLAGMTLDNFELLDNMQENLGKGSFGVVQKIRRKNTNKVYALKSMRKQEVIEGNLIDQVETEIQVQHKLKHKNVLRLYRHFEDSDNVYLLLEYCAKGELYQILRTQKCRRFTEPVACRFFVQVAEGLHYLHSNNIMHRDIKPENLLVNHDDVLKIADFGWCALSNTVRTTFCGTLDYLAPEMIQARGHDHTLDIWSAGVLLYEMIVGRPPFQSTNHTQLISRILSLELRFPQFVGASAQELVKHLLVKEPRDRLPLSESLRHPWVVFCEQATDTSFGEQAQSLGEASTPHGTPYQVTRGLSDEAVPSSIGGRSYASLHTPHSAVSGKEQQWMVASLAQETAGPQSPRVPERPLAHPQSPLRFQGNLRPLQPSTHAAMLQPSEPLLPSTPSLGTRTVASVTVAASLRTGGGAGGHDAGETAGTPAAPPAPHQQMQVHPGGSGDRGGSQRRPPSALRPAAAQSTQPQTVVYCPVPSPPAASRNLDSAAASGQHSAPPTPLQRVAYRAVTQSPPTELRSFGESPSTAEAVRRGLGASQRSAGAGRREPSLQHVSSHSTLGPQGAQAPGSGPSSSKPSAGGGGTGSDRTPTSPTLQKRRHSAAMPAKSGLSGENRGVGVAGVLASPLQNYRQLPSDASPAAVGGGGDRRPGGVLASDRHPARIRSVAEEPAASSIADLGRGVANAYQVPRSYAPTSPASAPRVTGAPGSTTYSSFSAAMRQPAAGPYAGRSVTFSGR